MKLWKKISLLCGLVLVLTAGVCTAVLTHTGAEQNTEPYLSERRAEAAGAGTLVQQYAAVLP